MKMKIEIEMDNAAFCDVPAGTEVARILGIVAREVREESGESLCEPGAEFDMTLRDVNGNRVGRAFCSCDTPSHRQSSGRHAAR